MNTKKFLLCLVGKRETNRRKTGSDLHQLYEFAKIDRVGGSRKGATQRLFFLYIFKSVIEKKPPGAEKARDGVVCRHNPGIC